jgi:hypothetical protein
MNKRLIKFYKGICLEKIHTRLIELRDSKTINEVDKFLKEYAGFNPNVSTLDMTSDELNELIVWSFAFGDEIGIHLNFLDNDCDFIREL